MIFIKKVTIPHLTGKEKRRAYIYVPDEAKTNFDVRYPVLYMFDGHNIFLDEDAAFGKSWGMETYMQTTCRDLIIVAVECNHEGNNRLMEYSPVTYRNKKHGFIPGKAPVYMKWLVTQLKPYVDAEFEAAVVRSVLTTKVMKLIREAAEIEEI